MVIEEGSGVKELKLLLRKEVGAGEGGGRGAKADKFIEMSER